MLNGLFNIEIIVSLYKNNLINVSLWGKKNINHKLSSYMQMKKHFK